MVPSGTSRISVSVACITGDFADDTSGEIEVFQTLTLKLPRYETYNLIGQYHKVNATILEMA